jgi:tripartite-type tricarboxylate transporter receptor subunit TctC
MNVNTRSVALRMTSVMSSVTLAFMSAAAFGPPAVAQPYPAKPIRLIVPFPPGGGTDVTARILTQALYESAGWQIVVENRAGATGRIGTELVAKAPPDGYTLLLGTAGPNAILPGAGAKLPYDAIKDFAPVSLIDSAAYALVAHPSVPIKTVRDLITIAGSKPGQITFASAGNLSVAHLAGEFFKQFAKVDIVHVPYKGGGPAVIATLSGETALYFGGPSVVQQTQAGKLRAIATTGAKRSKIFPALPAIAETLPGYEIAQWVGVLAPAGTPKDIMSSLHSSIAKAVGTAKVTQQFAAVGSERVGNSPEEFAAHIKSEISKWGKVVKASNVPLE